MPAIALPAALPASDAGSNFYQPAPTAVVDLPNAPLIQVSAPDSTAAPDRNQVADLRKRGEIVTVNRAPCRFRGCTGIHLAHQPCNPVPKSVLDQRWLACDIQEGLVWTATVLEYVTVNGRHTTTQWTELMTRAPAPGYAEYLATRTETPTSFPYYTKFDSAGKPVKIFPFSCKMM